MRSARGVKARIKRLPKRQREDVPTAHVQRLMELAFMLLRDGSIDLASYQRHFECSKRQFVRDLRHLRLIGEEVGFLISGQRRGRVVVQAVSGKLREVGQPTGDLWALMRGIAKALGTPVEREVFSALPEAGADRGFMYVRAPRPLEGSRVADVFAYFRDAVASRAMVEFRYVDNHGRETSRRVEPYHVVLRDGRYYLVAYDVGSKRDWRHFALDAVCGPFTRAGTYSPRPVPPRFHEERAVGWIEGATPMEVTFHVRPPAAAAIMAKQWQDGQHVSRLSGGAAEITLRFTDVQEAVRWALQFGAEAIVVAPVEAISAARATAARILAAYEGVPEREGVRAG